MDISKRVDTTATTQVFLTGEDIITLLKKQGELPETVNAKATFYVPGGGDWSHMTLEIDEENRITVTYEESNTSET
jgi:hypothetical protein